jgi:hypothetical protein
MMRGLTRKIGAHIYRIWLKVNLSELPRIEKFIFTASKCILIKNIPSAVLAEGVAGVVRPTPLCVLTVAL